VHPEMTAIVVNWNAGPHLARSVTSLLAAGREDLSLEILVVDNASTDGSLVALEEVDGPVRVIQTGDNLGYGTAANRGLQEARGTYAAVLNPDLVMAPGALRTMVDFLSENGRRGLVGPRLLDGEGKVRATCGKRPRLSDAICRKFLLHLVFPYLTFRRIRPVTPASVGWVTGACMVARRSALEAVGGFDEAIFMYFEDVDLCLRLVEAGWDVCYLPTAEGRHVGGESSKQALGSMLLASERSYRHFTARHLGRAASRMLAAMTPLEMILRSALWSAVFVASPARRQEAVTRLRAYRRAIVNDFEGVPSGGAPSGSTQGQLE